MGLASSYHKQLSYFLGLAVTGGDKDIETEDFVDVEFVFFNFLVEGGLVDDAGVTIEQVLLQFVGQNTFQRLAFVGFSNLTNNVSNLWKN